MPHGKVCQWISSQSALQTENVWFRSSKPWTWSWILTGPSALVVRIFTRIMQLKIANIDLANPIPRPVPNEQLVCDTSKPYNSDDTCYPLEKTNDKAWSLTEIFGRSLNGVCPLTELDGSSDQSVCLRVPHERGVFISEEAEEIKKDDGFTRCFKWHHRFPLIFRFRNSQ